MNHRTGILLRLLINYLFTCSNCGLTYIWNGNQDRVKDTGNNKSADTLNDVCRDAGSSTCSVDEEFTYEISACNEDDVCNTAKNDCNVAALLVFTDFLIKKSGSKGNKTFYHESDRNINEISADQVRKCRSDTACKEAPDRSENYTGEDHDSVPRVNVSAGSRSRDADGHGCHAGKCSKQSCEN